MPAEDRHPAQQIAFALMDAVRGSMGAESGLNLALRLVYKRFALLTSDTPEEIALWRDAGTVFQAGPGSASWLSQVLADPRSARRWEAEASHALPRIYSILDRLPEPGDTPRSRQVSRFLHAEVFEALLSTQALQSERTSGEYRTAPWMAQLMVGVTPEGFHSVLDPACGYGEALLAAGARDRELHLVGWEINADVASVAQMRLELAELQAEVSVHDALSSPPPAAADVVLLQPPWGMSRADFKLPDLPFGSPKRNLDLVWAQRALTLLASDGMAVVHMPMGAMIRGGAETQVRAGLVQSGLVEAVIELPEGMAFGTRVKSALLFLRARAATGEPVLMVDATSLGVLASRTEVHLSEEDVATISEVLKDWRQAPPPARRELQEPGLAKAVDAAELLREAVALVPSDHVMKVPEQPARLPVPPGRLLQELRITNFKSFGAQQRARLAPITLLYGPNAAGKSSVIQSLALMRQSLSAGRLVTQGDANLGSFEGLLHRHELDRPLEFGVTFAAPLKHVAMSETADPAAQRHLNLRVVADAGGAPTHVEAELGLDAWRVAFRPSERTTAEHAEGYVADTAQIVELLNALPYGLLFRPGRESARPLTAEAQAKEERLSARRVEHATRLLTNHFGNGVQFTREGVLPGEPSIDIERYVSGTGPGAARVSVIEKQFSELAAALGSVGSELSAILREMSWLGPLRSAPERFYARTETPGGGTRQRGEHVAMYLYDNDSEVIAVNEWFRKLDIPYELRVVPVFAGNSTATVGDLVAIVLRDRRLGVDTSPTDVGFGVSQVLPIVVELLAGQENLVAIEQPEIHLHPRLQAELADLVIAATNEAEQAKQVLIETHSEHLLLRLQRRIREGVLDAADVSVLYVDLQEGDEGARIIELRLDKNGYFLDEWPQGFFDERLDELLGGDE